MSVCAILIPGKLVKVSFTFVKSTEMPDSDQVPRYVQITLVVPYNLTAILTRRVFSYTMNTTKDCAWPGCSAESLLLSLTLLAFTKILSHEVSVQGKSVLELASAIWLGRLLS